MATSSKFIMRGSKISQVAEKPGLPLTAVTGVNGN